MASFRSGLKIICEISKKQGQGLLGRSFSADRSVGFAYQTRSLRDESNAERPARSSSWLSLWRKEDLLAPVEKGGREKTVTEDLPIVDTSLVCTIPVTPVGASSYLQESAGGPVEKMFELQEKHLHPKHAQQTNVTMCETSKKLSEAEFKVIDSKEFSHEPCEFPLTPRQVKFIKRLQHTSICSMDDLKKVEPPKQMYTRYKKLQLDERENISSMSLLHPVSVYSSLKKIFNLNTTSLNNSQNNVSITPRRFYSKSIMDPPVNIDNAMECKKKSKSKSKGKDKPKCVKVPSGIEGSQASTGECKRYKMPGCKVPKSTDCKPKPVKRAKCMKLEAPMPSYSECVKDPTPQAHQTECPRHDRGPPAECREEKHGISFDGCNPPRKEKPACLQKERKTGPKKKTKSCTDTKTKCDIKPYKEAGARVSTVPLKCPGLLTASSVTEPMNTQNYGVPVRNFSKWIMDPPTNIDNAMECKKKSKSKGKSKGKKGKKKAECVKVPSGIEGTQASTGECKRYKMPGCKVPKSTDCKPKPVKRAKCMKLEAPMPSYSECVKDPTPLPRPTECPRVDRGPPAECREEKHGISFDGCNPPRKEKPACLQKERKKAPKKKTKSCTDSKTECDVKPYKEAGAGLAKLPKTCPSSSTLTGVSEPSIAKKQFLLPKRSYSYSNIDPPSQKETFLECSSKKSRCGKKEKAKRKKCFAQEKVKKKRKSNKKEASPVSCQMKQDKKNRCDDPTPKRPWKVCKKPPALFTHKCPKRKKKVATARRRKVVLPCDTPIPTFKQCSKPKSTTTVFRCAELGPPKQPPPPRPPPTPKKCICDDDIKDLPPEVNLCRKVRHAKAPRKNCIQGEKDCSLTGKTKPECNKCRKNK